MENNLPRAIEKTTDETKKMWMDVGTMMSNAMSQNLTNMIKGAQDWQEALKNIFQSIADSFISMVTQMAINWAIFGAITGGAGFAGGGIAGFLGLQKGGSFWVNKPTFYL
jgi:hypothetical protein